MFEITHSDEINCPDTWWDKLSQDSHDVTNLEITCSQSNKIFCQSCNFLNFRIKTIAVTAKQKTYSNYRRKSLENSAPNLNCSTIFMAVFFISSQTSNKQKNTKPKRKK